MGNSVSAHIYETKVFRPNPVIYRLRLDPLPIVEKLVSLGTPNLAYSVVLGGPVLYNINGK